jgi:tRNA pseudouridine55 synthase
MIVFYQIMKPKQGILILNKKRGETPLECIKRFKVENPEYEDEKMTYAGRLDPLAEGLLLVLAGKECKNKEKYLKLDKEYVVEILIGFSTDAGDVMGIVEEKRPGAFDFLSRMTKKDIQEKIKVLEGKQIQKYPRFSSKTVKGKPLFELAKEGKLDGLDLPEKEIDLKSIEVVSIGMISKKFLNDFTYNSINSVKGDFRQNLSIISWENSLPQFEDQMLPTITIKVVCSSGSYMRVLAHRIGELLGFPALAMKIRRNRVGEYEL